MPVPPNNPTRNPHPLSPDGSFQAGRLPAALGTDYVMVDEKKTTDWVEFARRLAAHFNYVDQTNTVNGDWSPFFERQPAVAAARFLAWPLEQLGQRFAEHRELIEDQQGTVPREQLLDSLFDLLTSAVIALDRLTDRLVRDTPLRQRTEAIIEHQLAPAFGRWLAYYRAAAPTYFAALGVDEVPDYLRDAYAAGGQLMTTQDLIDGLIPLNSRWTDGESWPDYLISIGVDEVVYGGTPLAAQADDQILHAVGHVFFYGVYEAFVSSTLHLRSIAEAEWERLQTDPRNAPHIALLLAYLDMRERQKAMLNGLADRHLDLYYRRFLRTTPSAAAPPRAFLSLEARKNLPATYLPEGTTFRGGTDETSGLERQFLSKNAVSVSTASLIEQRALFKVANNPAVYDFPGENRSVFTQADRGRLYAATVVNSADGAGEEDLPEGETAFHPFGYRSKVGGHLEAGMSEARIGLGIASHYLYLKEGIRTITFQFTGINLGLLINQVFKVLLSTEEGWLERSATVNINRQLVVELTADDPAILPYDEEVHSQGLNTQLPVARIELPHDTGVYAYHRLRTVKINQVYLGLEVDGIRELSLSGSAGVIDPSQPFFPFGPAPVCKEVLHIGNKEVFQKVGAELNLNWEWKLEPDDMLVNIRTLREGRFESQLTSTTLNTANAALTLAPLDVIRPDFSPGKTYQAGDSRGYVRMRLWGEWGHQTYPTQLAEWTAETAAGTTTRSAPAAPPDLQFSQIYIDYEVDAADIITRAAQQDSSEYFQLTPFGWANPQTDNNGRMPLFHPVFPSGNWSADAGVLYLGLENWEAGSQLSLLFQIEEGTADPLLEKPDDHVKWHYLDGNEWQSFPNNQLQDGTEGLLRSGLVRLDLPAGTAAENTQFGDGLQWIRLSVLEKTDAVNRLLGIHTHGVEVVQAFSDGQSASNEPLAAGTISKLFRPLPGIKKVEQPYPTFDGKAPEERDSYYSRLSERLRHKDRGITEWDVEHLVLQEFPEVERVICLQHLEFVPLPEPGTYTYHELRAGHFTVLPLGRSGGDSLRPYVSLSTRENIENFLKARISCHATLHVRNPLFEEVRVVADVRFHTGTDESWALTQIETDIIDFISPWHDEGLGGLDFSAEVHRSSLVNFMEELDYVDYVKNVILLHLSDPSQNGSERLYSTKLVSVLAAAPSHLISPIREEKLVEIVEVCAPPRRTNRRARVSITDNPIEG